MSEIREKAVRLLLQAAYEMAADNADSVADIFDAQAFHSICFRPSPSLIVSMPRIKSSTGTVR